MKLNERHYGGLTGLNKARRPRRGTARNRSGSGAASFDIPPPELAPGGAFDLSADRRYAGLPIPATESLKDTIARVLPYWDAEIAPPLRAGQRVIVSAHGNSLRAAGQAPVGHLGRRDRRARDPDRPADRLRARCGTDRDRPLLSVRGADRSAKVRSFLGGRSGEWRRCWSASSWAAGRLGDDALCRRDADALGIAHETRVVSAHRTPQRLYDYAGGAVVRGLKAIVAGAGGAAHLPVWSRR